MKKSIMFAGLFLLFITGVKAQEKKETAQSAAQENKNSGIFTFEETTYNFGTVKQGETVLHDFKFTNTGNEPILISDAKGSCHCTVPDYPHEPIKKGGSGAIKVKFDSAGKQGAQDKTVTITSNASVNPMVLHLTGTVDVPPSNEGAQK